MFFKSAAVLCLAATATLCGAQQQLTNQSIMKMHDAGLSDDLIVAAINSQTGAYSTTVDDMIALKKAGIDDKVITAMVTRNATPPQDVAPPTAAAPLPPPEPAGKPRVFLTSSSKGPNQNAARDQSMEMSKDFEQFCPAVRITLNSQMADYTVALNHIEVGLLVRDNQFQVADKNGDLISKTKEGGSIAGGVKKVCGLILANWDASHPAPNPPPPTPPVTAPPPPAN